MAWESELAEIFLNVSISSNDIDTSKLDKFGEFAFIMMCDASSAGMPHSRRRMSAPRLPENQPHKRKLFGVALKMIKMGLILASDVLAKSARVVSADLMRQIMSSKKVATIDVRENAALDRQECILCIVPKLFSVNFCVENFRKIERDGLTALRERIDFLDFLG